MPSHFATLQGRVRRCTALLLLCCVAPRGAAAYFERLDTSSRALAFGEAYVALATDASGVAWNPGAMASMTAPEVQLTMSRPYFVPDLLSSAALVATPALHGAVGAGWHRLGNDFLAENQWFLSYGRWAYRDDHGIGYLGGSLKVGHVGVQAPPGEPEYGGVTVASADLGAFYQMRTGVSAGAVLRNVNQPEIDLASGGGSTPWRRGLDLGAAYRWRPESVISAGWTSDGRNRDAWRMGGEIWFYDVFAVRAGVFGTEFSGGFGLKTMRWQIDSSFVTHAQLGLTGRVTLLVPLREAP